MSNEAILGRVQKWLPGDYVHFLHTVKRENAFSNSTKPTVQNQKRANAIKTTVPYSSGGSKVDFCTHFSAKNTNPKKA